MTHHAKGTINSRALTTTLDDCNYITNVDKDSEDTYPTFDYIPSFTSKPSLLAASREGWASNFQSPRQLSTLMRAELPVLPQMPAGDDADMSFEGEWHRSVLDRASKDEPDADSRNAARSASTTFDRPRVPGGILKPTSFRISAINKAINHVKAEGSNETRNLNLLITLIPTSECKDQLRCPKPYSEGQRENYTEPKLSSLGSAQDKSKQKVRFSLKKKVFLIGVSSLNNSDGSKLAKNKSTY